MKNKNLKFIIFIYSTTRRHKTLAQKITTTFWTNRDKLAELGGLQVLSDVQEKSPTLRDLLQYFPRTWFPMHPLEATKVYKKIQRLQKNNAIFIQKSWLAYSDKALTIRKVLGNDVLEANWERTDHQFKEVNASMLTEMLQFWN